MKILLKKSILLPALGLIVIGGLFAARVYSNSNTPESNPQPSDPKRVTLISVDEYKNTSVGVKTVGTVEAQEQVDIKSQLSATVNNIPVELGQEVKAGDLIVELDHTDQDTQLAQAGAAIQRAQNNLDKVVAGAKDEEIQQAKSSVDSAKAGLQQAEAQLEQTVTQNESAIEQAELGLESARDQLNNNQSSNNQTTESAYQSAVNDLRSASTTVKNILNTYTTLQYAFFTCNDNQICHEIADQKEKVINDFYDEPSAGRWNTASVAELNGGLNARINRLATADSLDGKHGEIETTIDEMKAVFNTLKSAMSALETGMASYLANSATQAQRTALQNARSSVNSTHNMLTAAEQKIENANISTDSNTDSTQNSLEQAEQNLRQTKAQAQANIAAARSLVDMKKATLKQAKASYNSVIADPRNVDIAGLQASVQEAQARYQQLKNQRDKAFITAPFDAKIAALQVDAGTLTSPGTTVASLINEEGLQINMHINEKDRKLIAEQNSVEINDGQATGIITHIAPSIDEQTKKIEVIAAIQNQTQPLTVGEFVHAEITAQQTTNETEYTIPFRAVKTTDDASYVFTVEDGNLIVANEVKLGRVVGERVVVKDGLDPEMHIAASVRGLSEGDEVEIAE